MYNLDLIRQLAKTNKWQTLYSYSKDNPSINLFPNSSELLKIQAVMLRWLSVYEYLERQLTSGAEYLSREVIEDDIRTDAYLLMKRKEKNKIEEQPDNKGKTKSKTKKEVDQNSSVPSVIFRRKTD